jgi:hypothetical protein
VIDREVKRKSRRRGLGASQVVESLVAMWAAGGERTEDLDQFRQDKALALLLGTSWQRRRPRGIFWHNSTPRICRCCRTARRR